jgi:hypothetical protein
MRASSPASPTAGSQSVDALRPPTTSPHISPKVSATESFTIPSSIFDEVIAICSRLGIAS